MLNIPNSQINPLSRNFEFKKNALLGIQGSKSCFAGLKQDTVSFSGKTKYKNIGEPLKSTPNLNFKEELSQINGIKSLDKAAQRVSSLSRYLKEDMIGFIVPDPGTGKNYQWFERSLEFLIKGSRHNIKSKAEYKQAAKELFGLLATHDKYWKSPEFVKYLSGLEQNDFVKITIDAVKDLQKGNPVAFSSNKFNIRRIKKINDDGCAYTGKKMEFNASRARTGLPMPKNTASIEHILPQAWGGPNNFANYLIITQAANSLRNDLPLLDFLKGAD